MWTCTGAAQPGMDSTQSITENNQNLHITGDATFGLNVSGGEAFDINNGANGGTIEVYLSNNNDITSDFNAILIRSQSTDAITVTTNGNLTATGRLYSAIDVSNGGVITITTDGTLRGGENGNGIRASAASSADIASDINVTTNGSVTGGAEGMFITQGTSGAVNVMTTGTVTSNNEDAIWVEHHSMGNIDITTSNTVTTNAADKDAIHVNHTGTGNITLTVDGSVVGGSSANAIDLSTASGDATIILGTGASFTRGIDVSGVMGTASLEIGGTGNRSFDIGNIPAITGGLNFNKNGNHTLTVTGTHASGAAFEQTNINEGRLIWNSRNPLRSTSITLAHGASLEVMRVTSWSSNLTLSGRLAITGAGSGLELGTLTGSGGQIDIDVDFSEGDANLDSPKLLLSSVDGDSIAVNIRSLGEFPEISEDDEDGLITLGNLIQVTNTASPNTFVAGRSLSRGFRFELVHDDTNANVWSIVARAGGVEEALYESLPATLTQLASLQSYQQRLQGRQHGNNGRVWAKVSGASTEFEPASTSLATHEIGNVATEFGIDVPLLTDYPYIPYNLTVGASASFGEATTDVTAGESTGEIATRNFKAAILANWEYEDVYVDGQLQYAILGNEIKADTKLADEEATAYSAGLEVGYGIDVRGFRVTPSAQLAWTSVDFDNFTDLAGTEVLSDDSSIFTGRAGVGVEGSIPFANILLRGNADVLMPLDGKVNTKVDGTELVSEREDPVFDVGVGATYAWDETYMLTADISTQQGSEVKGYDANIGIKYKF